MIDPDLALERVLSEGDEWQSWRALRLSGESPGELPTPSYQDPGGGFIGPGGRTSPGATGEAVCHLKVIGAGADEVTQRALAWLIEAQTPAEAWLDPATEVPGEIEGPAAGRVWATASAACGLLAHGEPVGPRPLELLRGEAGSDGRFTGGAYPTFAASGAFWLDTGPRGEMAEWGLRWAREAGEEWWGPWEWVSGLTFWCAARVPLENPTVDLFIDELQASAPPEGWADDLGLTLRTLEVVAGFGA